MAWLSGVRFNGARVRGARGYLAARLGLEGPGVILQLGIEVKRLSSSLVTTLIRILHPIGQSLTGRIC